MKIKMKVKTMILVSLGILFFIFSVIPFANIELANYLSEKKPKIAEKLYDNYLKYPTGLRKAEVLYKKAENIMNDFKRYKIMMRGRSGSAKLDYITINKAIDNYKKIIDDYSKSDYYTLAYKCIMDSYIYLGDSAGLEEWIEWGKSKDDEGLMKISILYEGYSHFVNREYTKAEEILKSFTLGNKNMDYIYYFLKGHIEFARENFDKSLEYYDKSSEIDWQYKTNFFGTVIPERRESWLRNLEFYNGENKIKGRVTADGVGIPFVEIYLKYPNQGYFSRGENFIAITDKDGYYETIGVKSGKYEIGIGIGTGILFEKSYLDKDVYNFEISSNQNYDFKFENPIKVISPRPNEIIKNNKFEVEWEPVEGAEYYIVESVVIQEGDVMIIPIRDENKETRIKENKGVFDIKSIKNSPTGYSIDENEIVSPEAITGYLYEEKTTPIIVNAYDENGNMVGCSIPTASYYDNVPSIKIEGELTKGERLIVKKKYEKAVEYYEDLILEDENNIEALSYLSKLYIFGWGKGTIDIHKAIDYGRKVYDITGNADVILRVLSHMSPKNYRENKEIARELFDMIPKEYRDVYFYWNRGEYYSSLGEFEKAREDLLFADNIRDSDIIYIDIYYGKYKRAKNFLKDKDIRLYHMSKEKLVEGIELLSKLHKSDREYLVFKEYLSRLLKREGDYNERREDFKKIYSSIKNPGIRIILNEIKIDNHLD